MPLLMHRDIPVAKVEIKNGEMISVEKVINKEHLPVGTYSEHQALLDLYLKNWQEMRTIPNDRQSIDIIRNKLNCSFFQAQEFSNFMSLTDTYWVKPIEMRKTFDEICFINNEYHIPLAEMMYIGSHEIENRILSPDWSTDGSLDKAWIRINNIPVLLKSGNFGCNADGKNLLSANECISSEIAELMGIEHVKYIPFDINGKAEIICGCESFVKNTHEDFINASQLQMENKRSDNLYSLFQKLGFQKEVDQMIIFDHIIHNTDRHEKNFGIIRDADTLENLRFAPVFDSGSSFGWNQRDEDEHFNECKPFKNTFSAQLNIVNKIPCEIPEEEDVENIIEKYYEKFKISEKMFQKAKIEVKVGIMQVKNHFRNMQITCEDIER